VQNTNSETRKRLSLDSEGFAEKERLVSYEMGNALLMLNLELQRNFGLRAEEYQVFMLIILSTVQRFVRNPGSEVTLLGRAAMPPEVSGSISRRRIAETLDIPFETVRRTVASLLARDLIVEHRRGVRVHARRHALTSERQSAARAYCAQVPVRE